MTDKPATLSLDAQEWRVMLIHNLSTADQAVKSTEKLSPEGMKAFHDHLDRMKALVTAWHNSAPAEVAGEVAPAAQAGANHTNGAAPEKRKGGWQKGRKRGSPAQAVQ